MATPKSDVPWARGAESLSVRASPLKMREAASPFSCPYALSRKPLGFPVRKGPSHSVAEDMSLFPSPFLSSGCQRLSKKTMLWA